ncbi:MAG: iron transporter [Planctomycetota bacterium]|nr:MAG: iron transporter [Planctomycetota bacterium]
MLVAATGVGAGDLMTAGLAGARLGVSIFWAVLFGAILKWTLNEGIARWQLATGESLLEGWATRMGLHWPFLAYLLIWSFVVGGALISAAGVAGVALIPLGEDVQFGRRVWGIVHSIAGVVLIFAGGFRVFERMMGVCIGVMFVTVMACAVWIAPQVDWSALRWVNPLQLSGDELKWTLGLIGGVGGTVTLLSYGYWIREEGRQGASGLWLCRLDLALGYGMTAAFGVGMLIIAAATPEISRRGAELLVLLSERLGGELGPVARWLFLLGAWGAIFSSLLGVWQGVPYLFADALRHTPLWRPPIADRSLTRTVPYRLFVLFLAGPTIVLLWRRVEWVQLWYAVLGALFMPALAATLLVMNNHRTWTPAAFRSGWRINLLLVITLAFFLITGAQKLVQALA